MYSPIIIFVYNRADHFEQTYNALSKCAEAKNSELYIFSDGPKNENAVGGVNEVRNKLESIKNKGDFRCVTITESEENKGLALSIITGVSSVLKKHGRAIILEDDSIVAPSFLCFMNRALDEFENEKRVGAVAGYTPEFTFPTDYKEDIFTSYRSCSCGWATWNDRFDNVDWQLDEIGEFYKNREMIKKFNSSGTDRFVRLYRQTQGNGSSWSVRFGLHLVRNDMLTVYPRYSYIQNIGCDETGVHSRAEDAETMKVDLSKAIESPEIHFVSPDKRIEKTMKKHYSAGMVSEIKRRLAMEYILIKGKKK